MYVNRYLPVRFILIALAVVCFAIFTVVSFGWFGLSSSHPFGFLGLGATAFAAAFI